MREVKIKSSKNYSVYITSSNANLPFLLNSHKIKKCFVITDSNVHRLYSNYLNELNGRIIGVKVLEPGEKSKNIEVVLDIYNSLIDSMANRKTAIIALGGGVVGDISGFVAATFMRGIPLIHIPTTLMSQCDSSIGGKNGFNLNKFKNIIGTFYQPEFVYSDVNFLKTLSVKEFRNGLAEVIKYGIACDSDFFHFIEENRKAIKEREIDKLLHMVLNCSKIKGSIVEKDELDGGIRHILNYGHTIGHSLESVADFKIPHGEAVAIGMSIEALIAVKAGFLEEKEYRRVIKLITDFELPDKLPNVNIKEVIEFMKMDKKNTTNSVKFVLLDKIGHAIITTEIKQNMMANAIEEFVRRKL